MNVTHISESTATRHEFDISIDGTDYHAIIFVDQKGRFIDEEISYKEDGDELDSDGAEGDIREKIIDYIASNWDNLTKESEQT